jgi:hypothetical protein
MLDPTSPAFIVLFGLLAFLVGGGRALFRPYLWSWGSV